MNVLMQKDEKWRWEEAQQKAFDDLKRVFTIKPVLVAPDLDKEFWVEADTSNYATGGVLLSQMVTYLFVIGALES